MQLVICVLNRTELLDTLLKRLVEEGIRGATILDSTGLLRALADPDDLPVFGVLRRIIDPEREHSRTILIAAEKKQVAVIRDVVNEVTGGLNQPDTGILIGLPIDFIEGVALTDE
ncbi:MAG: hypothetical protein KBA30_03820 [Clostridia bacterium]|nr:hypothetical protein [Clostridia bacterium]